MHEPHSADDIVARRRALRSAALSAREALTVTARSALTHRLQEHLSVLLKQLAPATLGFCWPFRAEPDLRHFMAAWLAEDAARCAALPVVLDREVPLVFRRWLPGMALQPDRHGIPHPPAGEEVIPDVVLVPLNAFDSQGFRLGYGGGYFDRTLAVLPVLAVGVGFELGRVDSVLPQPHDRPMEWLVTEAGAFRP
ncbi:MAG: 5-formyltetrahydrofolate cyclo-ligase [Pseudazoarcus pumilus]|nr:5-formyltetrahydrofolate cyclo-ligase [Pseudazoarcus pumilus]